MSRWGRRYLASVHEDKANKSKLRQDPKTTGLIHTIILALQPIELCPTPLPSCMRYCGCHSVHQRLASAIMAISAHSVTLEHIVVVPLLCNTTLASADCHVTPCLLKSRADGRTCLQECTNVSLDKLKPNK